MTPFKETIQNWKRTIAAIEKKPDDVKQIVEHMPQCPLCSAYPAKACGGCAVLDKLGVRCYNTVEYKLFEYYYMHGRANATIDAMKKCVEVMESLDKG